MWRTEDRCSKDIPEANGQRCGRQHGLAMGIFMAGISIGPALEPSLGGYLDKIGLLMASP